MTFYDLIQGYYFSNLSLDVYLKYYDMFKAGAITWEAWEDFYSIVRNWRMHNGIVCSWEAIPNDDVRVQTTFYFVPVEAPV